jgi:twinkle protein
VFKEIVLVFDNDKPGADAVQNVLKIIPDALVATLPAKDANECLVQGRAKAAYNACQFNAQKPKNTRLVSGNELHDKAREPPKYGVSWPWKHITEATRGIRFGETIYIGAGQKQGKSEVVNTLAAHFIKEHGCKVFLVKPEESNNKTYKLVAGKLAGKFFHDPNKPFDGDAYDKAGEVIKDHLYMLNLYQHVGWDTLKGDIRSAAAEGCRVIIIDPITNLTNGMDAASANVKLQEIAQELSAMALDLNVVIFIFCHLRNPDSGNPHERGGEVLSSQFAGSRAMARSCNLMLGLEGNRDPNLSAEERNLRTLVLLEDREFGETGRYRLYWDKNSGLFNEIA